MTINEPFFQFCQKQDSSTGFEPQVGEVLAPLFVQDYYMSSKDMGLLRGTFRKCYIIGIPILTAFVPVLEEEYESTVYWYNSTVNDYLNQFRKPSNNAPEFVSWESFTEKQDLALEDEEIEKFLLVEQFDYLKKQLSTTNPEEADIVSWLFEGVAKKDIYARLGLQKSAGYKKINQTIDKAYSLYCSMNQ